MLPGLTFYNGIIGDDTLRELEAVIDNKISIPLAIYTDGGLNKLSPDTGDTFSELITESKDIFGPIMNELAATINQSRNTMYQYIQKVTHIRLVCMLKWTDKYKNF